jgi:hypothetical protein
VQRKSETVGNNESIVFVLATLDNGSRQLQFAVVHEPLENKTQKLGKMSLP